jgi:hypothetical protein
LTSSVPATGDEVSETSRFLGLGELIERALLTALLAATLAALALVAHNRLAPVQAPLTFGLVLWAGFASLYLALLMPVMLAAGAAVARHAPNRLRVLAAAPALGFLALASVSDRGALRELVALPGPPRAPWLATAAAMLAAAGLVALALAPSGRRRLVRSLAAAALLAATGALVPEPLPDVPAPLGSAGALRMQGPPLIVIGIDGADWRLMEPLLARGDLPNLQDLRRRGAFGPLKTLTPTISPPIWTTIATGRSPRAHGVKDFTVRRLLGVDDPLPRLLPLRRLGSNVLLSALERTGALRDALITSAVRRVPAFWNIASFHRSPVAVVGWWASWPAEPVFGFVVSDRAYYEELAARGKAAALPPALAYPQGLMEELRGRIVLPDQVTIDDVRPLVPDVTEAEFRTMQVRHPSPLTGLRYELTYNLSVFMTTHRIALELIERGRAAFAGPPDLLVLFKLVDGSCHTGLKYSDLVPEPPGVPAEERRLFRDVVAGAYRATDAAVGEILAATGDANVVVVSDHGFDFEGGRFNHDRAPDGILLAAGPAFRAGRVDGLGVHDVMPLLLQARGLPLAEDLEGRLPTVAFAPGFLESVPTRSVRTYGRWGTPHAGPGTAAADAAAIERLRALGYLQ